MTIDELPADRRISGLRLDAVLGAWQRPGPAYVGARRRAARRDPLRLRPAEHPPAQRARARRGRRRLPDDDDRHLRPAARRGLPREPARLGHRHHAPVRTGRARVDGRVRRAGTGRRRPRDGGTVGALVACTAPTSRRSTHSPATSPARATRRSACRCCARPSPRWYTARGTPTTPDQVLVTTGAQQAIHLLVTAHAGPGDRVVVEHPTYPHAIDVVRAVGARPVPVPSGATGLDIDLLESTLRQVVAPAGLPDPRPPQPDRHEPDRRGARAGPGSGAAVPHGDRRRRGAHRAHARRAGAQLVRGRRHGVGLRRVDRVRVQDLLGRPAGRLGACAPGPRRPAGQHPRAHRHRRPPCSSSSSWPSCSRSRPTCSARRRRELRARRDLLVGLLLDQLPSWRVDVPAGGLSLWVDLGAPVSSALAAISHPARRPRGRPGTAFGVDGSFERQPAAAVHRDARRPAPGRRRAGRGVGGAGRHRAGHADPTGSHALV